MSAARARLTLIQIVIAAAIVLASVSAYSTLPNAFVLERDYEGSPDADVQSFPWHLECRDLTRFYDVLEAVR